MIDATPIQNSRHLGTISCTVCYLYDIFLITNQAIQSLSNAMFDSFFKAFL
jgi:hypothetical protein